MNEDLILELDDEEDDLYLDDSNPYMPSGTEDYNELWHKPQINGVELQGNMSINDLFPDGLIIDGGGALGYTNDYE